MTESTLSSSACQGSPARQSDWLPLARELQSIGSAAWVACAISLPGTFSPQEASIYAGQVRLWVSASVRHFCMEAFFVCKLPSFTSPALLRTLLPKDWRRPEKESQNSTRCLIALDYTLCFAPVVCLGGKRVCVLFFSTSTRPSSRDTSGGWSYTNKNEGGQASHHSLNNTVR